MSTACIETPDIATSSADYARRFSGSVGAWFLEIQERAVLRMLRPYAPARVIDVGGGHGQLTAAMLRGGHEVTVLGSDPVCRERVAAWVDGERCRFETGNLLELPFADRSFDVAVSVRLLPHVSGWRRLVGELCRVARRAVIVDFPSLRSVNSLSPWLFGFKRRLEGNTRPFTCFRERDIRAAFAAHHFEAAERSAQFFLPMVLYRTLRCRPICAALESGFRLTGLTGRFGSPVVLKMVRKEGV